MKHYIKTISVIGTDKILILTTGPLRTVIIPWQEVEVPFSRSALELAQNLTEMVTSCVCGSTGSGGGG